MPQKDYVKRGQAKRATPNSNKRKPAAQKGAPQRPLMWRYVIMIFIVLAAVIVGLWQLKDSSKATPDAPLTERPTIIEDELPELPKEEWDYIKNLPGYEVEVDQSEHETSGKRYLMQCASFKTRSQAEEMKAKIAFQGKEAQIRHTGDWFRVILGPYNTKRDAERDRHALRKINIATCQIWYWNN